MPATRILKVEDRSSANMAATSIEGLPRFRIQFEYEVDSTADASPTNWELGNTITRAVDSLLSLQREDGHWVFELEADATMPASFILLQHYLEPFR
jgi:Squalene-hopene cyclase N-terminal domain